MSYKVLEQNGIDNENIDGGAFNRFTTGGRDGIIKGVLSECALNGFGNGVSLAPGLIVMCGIRVKITELETLYISGVPIAATQYQIVAQATLNADRSLSVIFLLKAEGDLRQDALYAAESGVYEVKIGSFVHNTDGSVSNLIRTLDVINGGSESADVLEVGTVETNTLAAGLKAEFDVTLRPDPDAGKTFLDFTAGIPQGASGVDDEAVHFTLQTLTAEQKTQARENIDAISKNDTVKNAVSLQTPRLIGGVEFDGSTDIVHYGVCSSRSMTTLKTVDIPGFKLVEGATIIVRFTAANSVNNPTLNINETGDIPILAGNDTTYVKWRLGDALMFVYSDVHWVCLGGYRLANYPVGSHCIQYQNEPTPASLFGGTWTVDTDYTGRVLVGSGTGYTLGATGGEATHTMAVAELPKIGVKTSGTGDDHYYEPTPRGALVTDIYWGNYQASDGANVIVSREKGNPEEPQGKPFNIMQPYKVVAIWKRMA